MILLPLLSLLSHFLLLSFFPRPFGCPPCIPGLIVLLHDLGEDVALAHDLDLAAIDLDVAATVAAEDHLVALHDGRWRPLGVVPYLAGAAARHTTALRFFLGGSGQRDAAA